MSSINKILYPTDLSEHSQAALALAVDLAKRYGAELHCLQVVDIEHEFFMEGGYIVPLRTEPIDSEQLRRVACRRMEEFVDQHLSQLDGVVRQVVVLGKPFEQIIRHAHWENVDPVVMGTHGGGSGGPGGGACSGLRLGSRRLPAVPRGRW